MSINYQHTFDLPDRNQPGLQRVADLAKESSYSGKYVLIEDAEPLGNALRAGIDCQQIYRVGDYEPPAETAAAIQASNTAVDTLSPELAKSLFRSDKRPDLFAIASNPRPARAKDLVAAGADVLVLDGVRIPGNIGAIVRSAYAFGAGGIILVNSGLKNLSDRRLIRASRGYLYSLPVALFTPGQLEAFLQDHPYQAVGLAAQASEELSEVVHKEQQFAWVLGSEVSGLSTEIAALCQREIRIEMNPAVESLNVSVSAGILLQHRFAAQRG